MIRRRRSHVLRQVKPTASGRSLAGGSRPAIRPVEATDITGQNGADVLTRVTLIGNDLALDNGVGTCGRNGQSVPVGVGQPTIRIDGLTVGGSAT